MKSGRSPLLILGFLAVLALPASAAVLQVNLGQSGLPTELGFTDWTTPDGTAPPPTTIGGIELGINDANSDGSGFRSINRGDSWNGPLDNLTQSWWGVRASSTGTGGRFSVIMDGADLGAGTFSWTSWHHDHQDQAGEMTIDFSVDGGSTFTSAATGFDIVNGNTPAAPNPAGLSFTSNGTDDVWIRFTNTGTNGLGSSGPFALLNGFEVEATVIPEPSAALLGLLGLLGLSMRRRRRI